MGNQLTGARAWPITCCETQGRARPWHSQAPHLTMYPIEFLLVIQLIFVIFFFTSLACGAINFLTLNCLQVKIQNFKETNV